MSYAHKRIHERSNVTAPVKTRLEALSVKINASLNNQSSEFYNYHPDRWTFNGYPHDTFAVEFMKKDPFLSMFLQIVPFLTIICLSIIIYMSWPEQGLEEYLEDSEEIPSRETKKNR